MQNRYDTKTNWSSVNPVLRKGEFAIENDSGKISLKVGDGVTAYNSLPYVSGGKSDSLLGLIYPVGSFYFSAVNANPKILFGFGEWQAVEQGRVLLSQGANYPAGSKGGESSHVLTINEMPSHRHKGLDIDNVYIFGWDKGTLKGYDFQNSSTNYSTANRITTGYVGDGGSHNNMQPYISVYIYQRIK